MSSLRRIGGLLRQEWYISKRALEIVVDVPFFAVIDVLVFGYVSLYVSGGAQSTSSEFLIFGALWWEVIRITQYTMTVGSLWNVWSRNLSNMFIAPISLTEYLAAQMFSGLWKSGLVIFFLLYPISYAVFHFNLFSIGVAQVFVIYINLLLFSWSIGLMLLGAIFRYGTRVQALGWAFIFIFQPLGAVFFPVHILPQPLQYVAYLFPAAYIFEGGRAALSGAPDAWNWQIAALVLNCMYFLAALFVFKRFLYRAQNSGQFARNEI